MQKLKMEISTDWSSHLNGEYRLVAASHELTTYVFFSPRNKTHFTGRSIRKKQ
jgi:hypothetical protein